MAYLLDTNACIRCLNPGPSLVKQRLRITPLEANDLTLVTHNTQEFSRVRKIKLEDWEA